MAARAHCAGIALSAALSAAHETRHAGLGILVLACALAAHAARGEAMIALDPFGQATSGIASCPAVKPPMLTDEEARVEAHVRAERGTRCGMDGTCEAGGAYRRDPEINAQVIAAIGADQRFRDTSVWVTTTRRWVTLQGCVRSDAQRKRLVSFAAKQPNVERVFDELKRMPSR